jgi:hypothetical protein
MIILFWNPLLGHRIFYEIRARGFVHDQVIYQINIFHFGYITFVSTISPGRLPVGYKQGYQPAGFL